MWQSHRNPPADRAEGIPRPARRETTDGANTPRRTSRSRSLNPRCFTGRFLALGRAALLIAVHHFVTQPICAQTTFGPQQAIAGSTRGAFSVYAADLDGDGDTDVLSASVEDDKIAWYENTDGAGGFGAQRIITTAAKSPRSVFAADLDGDGDLDVLSASAIDDKIAWYENTDGAGAFGPLRIITTAAEAALSVGAADLDGDGDLDVLSASASDDKIAWYENTDGKGGFGPQQVITITADRAQAVHAADLDGDGDTDVLSASEGDDKIAWYENMDGAGGFGPERVITTNADGVSSLDAADLDGDGDIDILSAIHIGDRIGWYENKDGAGNFGPIKVITTAVVGPESVYAADIDGDGDIDALSASSHDSRIAWYENTNGAGRFRRRQDITRSADGAFSVYAADLDSDGDTDVLSASAGDDKIAWYENTDGAGGFGPQQIITSVADNARSVYAADLDGDGDSDVLSASATDDKIAWYENMDGAGGFGPQRIITTLANGAESVHATDLDGDGDNDVLSASQYDDKIAWYENMDGAGRFGPGQVISTAADGGVSVYPADLDGDDDTDVLSASYNDDKISWYENTDGTGDFWPQQIITNAADRAWSVHATDLDGDGDLDVLSASSSDDKIAWYENTDGAGSFGPQQMITAAADAPFSVYAADLDGDGDPDVLSASAVDDKIAWYENTDGAGSFGIQQVISAAADGAWSVYAIDLDDDGDIDVLSASSGDDKIAWYENTDGAGGFGPQQVISTAARSARSVYAADLDGDGDIDVLSASELDDKIAWYENLLPPPPVRVSFPNGGDTLPGDSLLQIEWRTNVSSAGTGVRLELWDSDGFIVTLGYDWDPSGQHTATVYLPLMPEKDDYRIRVVSTFDSDVFDESDEPFTITGGAVKIHTPNGGETWSVNTLQPIHWKTSVPFAGRSVDMELWNGHGLARDLGASWDPDGDALELYLVPETIPNGDDYRIRIISTWAPELFDESDAPFSILGGPERNAVDACLWTLYR